MNNANNTHELIIPLSRKSEAEKLVKKLQRKADKLGQFAPVISWGEKFIMTVEIAQGIEIEIPAIRLNLTCQRIGLDGWSVLASITHGAESNVVLCFGHDDDSATEIAEQFRNVKPHCDHCGKVRSRKTTMIVRDEQGTLRQVGSTCLKEYTGIDPAYVLSVGGMIDMLRDFDEDQDLIGDRASRDGLPVDVYLAWVIAAVEVEGGIFTTRNMAGDHGSSTASLAYTIGRESCNASHYAAAKEVAQWAKDIDDDSSSFELNMRAIAQNGFVEYKHDGIAAYIYEAFRKAQERAEKEAIEVATATQVAESTHVGTVGTRETFKVTLNHVFRVETQWGDSYGHKFVTDSGAVIMWWTSSRVDLDRGESAIVKATVKEHTEYNGQLQTKVTRVKVA
tara:strand:+ start:3924 stop:5102 length:1179 start_codon:yes stop_codon:yes gene_type:complete